jgi:hypothetical protein
LAHLLMLSIRPSKWANRLVTGGNLKFLRDKD